MKKVIFIFVILTSLTLLLTSCLQEKETGTIIASVDNFHLTLEDLIDSYSETVWNEMSRDEQREIVNQWIELTALYAKSIRNENIRNDNLLKFLANNSRKKLYANALIADELQNLTFSNEEMYNFYRLREAEFTYQVREFNVQRIFFNEEADMRRVKAMLDRREINYTPAAQRFSQEPIGRNGGYMPQLVTKNGADSDLWEQLDRVDRFHELLMPYEEGWVIVRWIDFRFATTSSSFINVRDEIEQMMKEERKNDLYESVLNDARAESNIVIRF